ncbi:mechanosensitive ion channel domain-containing protein, partial [Citrobacter sp. TBCS-14]|uniref:mechanosensitive ion channel domain-containing protein n=1 Tax=Citrobacter sp. TBCS-14 TaxID=2576409 RepID=UPI00113C787B
GRHLLYQNGPGYSAPVERMSIRSVGVRQDTGAYHIIPWSSITTFANFVRGIGSVVANYDVDRHEDADKAN